MSINFREWEKKVQEESSSLSGRVKVFESSDIFNMLSLIYGKVSSNQLLLKRIAKDQGFDGLKIHDDFGNELSVDEYISLSERFFGKTFFEILGKEVSKKE